MSVSGETEKMDEDSNLSGWSDSPEINGMNLLDLPDVVLQKILFYASDNKGALKNITQCCKT